MLTNARQDVIGGWQQAGSVLRIAAEQPWMCLRPELWEGLEGSEALVRQDMTAPSGEEYQYQDRRQEIVFIGHRMQRSAIQELLDSCLLTEEEMELGPEKWKETRLNQGEQMMWNGLTKMLSGNISRMLIICDPLLMVSCKIAGSCFFVIP